MKKCRIAFFITNHDILQMIFPNPDKPENILLDKSFANMM